MSPSGFSVRSVNFRALDGGTNYLARGKEAAFAQEIIDSGDTAAGVTNRVNQASVRYPRL